MLSPVQRQILGRYETTCAELGYSSQKTRTRVKRFAEAMLKPRIPTLREKQIRAAIEVDRKAEKEFRFFIAKGHQVWALLSRLEAWIDTQGEHHTIRDQAMEILVPRDRVLLALRTAGQKGLLDTELRKISPRTWLLELRKEGVTFDRFKDGEIWRTVLTREPTQRKPVKLSDVYRDISQKIELLGNPPPFEETGRIAGTMSRLLRFHERDLRVSPFNDFRRVMEEDLARVAGCHLKRMAYLMAITWQAVKSDQRSKRDLAETFFWRLDQRRRRATRKK